jgi:hypothetical protein
MFLRTLKMYNICQNYLRPVLSPNESRLLFLFNLFDGSKFPYSIIGLSVKRCAH